MPDYIYHHDVHRCRIGVYRLFAPHAQLIRPFVILGMLMGSAREWYPSFFEDKEFFFLLRS
jgi:hypothetical protein